MKKLFNLLLIVIFLSGCSTMEEHRAKKEGWEVVGKINGCVLYTKMNDGWRIYWSVCDGGNSSVAK